MKRILFIPSDQTGGVYYYRTYTPMKKIAEIYKDEYNITINGTYKFTDEDKDEIGRNYDIVIFHQCLYTTELQDAVWKLIVYCKKEYGTKFVLDLDDYYVYHKNHPAYDACIFNAFPAKMELNMKLFDYITTTTEYFKMQLSKSFDINKIFVFENAISFDDVQFSTEKNPSDKLRIGLTGGASHTEDIKQIIGMHRFFTKKQLDEIEFVFCGYDTRNATEVTIDENGKIIERKQLDNKKNWWVQMDNQFRTSYKNYKRIDTKSITKGEFGSIYKDIDVLLVPLTNNEFNRCKSELKFIESGFTNTAVIASKVIPYSNFGTDGVDCLLVKDPTPECWAKAVKKMLRDRELLTMIKEANAAHVRYARELESITHKRKIFFDSI